MPSTAKQYPEIAAFLERHQFSIVSRFVPASVAAEQAPADDWRHTAINFRVAVSAGNATIYRGPYAYGIGNLPGYRHGDKTALFAASINRAREYGQWNLHIADPASFARDVPAPALIDVVYSLVSGASAIDYATFGEWASDLGYDTDSRNAETIYRSCLQTGLALRAALGDADLAELRELYQDF